VEEVVTIRKHVRRISHLGLLPRSAFVELKRAQQGFDRTPIVAAVAKSLMAAEVRRARGRRY
jgi:hypothetical protein